MSIKFLLRGGRSGFLWNLHTSRALVCDEGDEVDKDDEDDEPDAEDPISKLRREYIEKRLRKGVLLVYKQGSSTGFPTDLLVRNEESAPEIGTWRKEDLKNKGEELKYIIFERQ